jgi:Sulfotransferase family
MNSNVAATRISPPFFVVGCTRSGTTLISRILDGHSKLAVYHESHFYHLLRHDLHRYGDLGRRENLRRFIGDVREVIGRQKKMAVPSEEEFLDTLAAPTFESVLAAMLHHYARQQGKIRGGDKTPGHHTYLSEILQNLPESHVIFLLRDPRDTVVAIREKFGVSLNGATALWNAAFVSYKKFPERVHLVRYEEFVQRPAESVAALCVYLDEDYQPDMLRFFERIPARLAKIRYNQDLLGPVSPSHVGRFRELPRRDIERIEAACGIGMEAMGYEFSGAKPRALPIEPPTKPAFLMDRLRYYRWDWGRWQRGWTRWKIVLRVRARYFFSLGWRRN